MNIVELIQHPERLNKETLYDLRSLVALYPYYQTARILMLQNLYLLHDPTFDEELRRAAVYITDRKVIFNLVEASHYKIRRTKQEVVKGDRTVSLIDNFLSTIPEENKEEIQQEQAEGKPKKRKPTPADATIDYVAYLISADFDEEEEVEEAPSANNKPATEMKGMSLIDNFIENQGGKITLKDEIEYTPDDQEHEQNAENEREEEYYTETLAGIYIKQGKYSKALEIIKRLNLQYPKKNVYFADQIRFLEKLILNSGEKVAR